MVSPWPILWLIFLVLGVAVILLSLWYSDRSTNSTPPAPTSSSSANLTGRSEQALDAFEAFPTVMYINLDKRTDRRQQLEGEFTRVGMALGKAVRIPGVPMPEGDGAQGCSQAHIHALEYFLKHSTDPYCVVIEDDFKFTQTPAHIQAALTQFLTTVGSDWDVLLLSGKVTKTVETPAPYKQSGVVRVLRAHNTDAYVVNRAFVPVLLDNFQRGLTGLQKTRNKRYHLDVYWKKLQRAHRWYALQPLLGTQRESYSDIRRKVHNKHK